MPSYFNMVHGETAPVALQLFVAPLKLFAIGVAISVFCAAIELVSKFINGIIHIGRRKTR